MKKSVIFFPDQVAGVEIQADHAAVGEHLGDLQLFWKRKKGMDSTTKQGKSGLNN